MADDTAKLVVSLEARFDKFEKAMRDVASSVDKQTKVIEDRFASMAKTIEKEFGNVASILISQAGLAGRVLGSLGIGGTVAAIGLGALALAFAKAAEMAEKFGDKAKELRAISQITGLTPTQITAIQKLGREFGVAGEQVATFVERFTANMDAARQGTGDLFTAVLRIDRSLALQLSAAKDSAEALDILAKAYVKAKDAGNQFLATRLTTAAGGRGGLVAGPILEAIGRGGGLAPLTAASTNIDQMVERMAKLKVEIEETKKRTERIWASLASEEILQLMLKEAKALEQMALHAKALKEAEQQTGTGLFQRFANLIAQSQIGAADPAAGLRVREAQEAELLRRRAETELRQGLTKGARPDLSSFDSFLVAIGRIAETTEKSTKANNDNKASAEALLRLEQARISALGPAATQEEQRRLRVMQLNELLKENVINQRDVNRSLQEYDATQTASSLAAREALGISTQADVLRAKELETTKLLKDARASETEAVRALNIARKEGLEKFEALQVRLSATPGFTKLTQDATNFAKIVDQFAVSSVNHLTDAIVDAASGSKSFEQAFRDMARVVLQELSKLLIKFALLKALNVAGIDFSSLTPGRAAGGPVIAGGSFMVGERGPELFVPATSGFIVPNQALGSGGGVNVGGSNTTVNIQGSADRSTIAAMQQMFADRDRRFVVDVANASRELRRRSVRM